MKGGHGKKKKKRRKKRKKEKTAEKNGSEEVFETGNDPRKEYCLFCGPRKVLTKGHSSNYRVSRMCLAVAKPFSFGKCRPLPEKVRERGRSPRNFHAVIKNAFSHVVRRSRQIFHPHLISVRAVHDRKTSRKARYIIRESLVSVAPVTCPQFLHKKVAWGSK